MENLSELFGQYAFNDSMMQKRLPKETYKAWTLRWLAWWPTP